MKRNMISSLFHEPLVLMRISLLILISMTEIEPVKPMPSGLLEWYTTAQEFRTTLHAVLTEGADDIEQSDVDASKRVRTFEYNWLSLLGIYRGLLPLISDFYFHYYKNKEFEGRNGQLVQSLRSLVSLFTSNGSDEDICTQINVLVAGSIKAELFKDGAIKNFLGDLDEIVGVKPHCQNLIQHAKAHNEEIAHFLRFILRGAPKPIKKAEPNSEL